MRAVSRSAFPLLAAGLLFLAGCVQTKQTTWLNPDGRARVTVEANLPSPGAFFGAEATGPEELEKQARQNAANLIRQSSGVDAWTDVSWGVTPEGRMTFSATAYCPDMSAVEMPNINLQKFSFEPDGEGNRVFLLAPDEPGGEGAPEAEPLSEEEIARRVTQERAQFQQGMSIMRGFLSDLRMESVFHLPGRVVSRNNLEAMGDNILGLTFSGDRLVDVMTELAAEESFWRRQVTSGESMEAGPFGNEEFIAKYFGSPGAPRAVVSGPMEDLFDYDAEVARAREGMDALREKLGISSTGTADIPVIPSPGTPIEVQPLTPVTRPADPGTTEGAWSIDEPMATIPNRPLSGSLFGHRFELGKATIGRHLEFESRARMGSWPAARLVIFQVGLEEIESRRTWIITPVSAGSRPHVHLNFMREGATLPGTLMFTGEYSLRLVISSVSDSTVEGRIHLSLPDYRKSHLVGSFSAAIQR